MKYCSGCDKVKSKAEFYKKNAYKDGLDYHCKECRREYSRYYYQSHKQQCLAHYRHWRKNNREKAKELARRWRKNNPERVRIHQRNFEREYYRKNPVCRLSRSFGGAIRQALKGNKEGSKWDFLPYSLQDLKEWLQSQFEDGMTWNNYGEWHIDHIIPVSFFEFVSPDDVEFKMCWRLENLQPMWARDNVQKNDRLPEYLTHPKKTVKIKKIG